MGLDLLERPVFRKSVLKSMKILQKLGCDWDIVEELRREVDHSKLSKPEISQPICTVLQLALVKELKAWGVTPAKVVGHSSGEIAAAYSIGALSHNDAIAIAYFRGKVSTGLRHLNGGMMAVGTSPEEARKLIADSKLSSGSVSIACVNSPSNVTLSGDSEALEELKTNLEKREIFARRLKVEVAYHSTHMNTVMNEYSSLITHIEPLPSPENQAVQVSSVTGLEIDSELLGPYYWVRNLISPVLFADAVKEMVIPSEGDGNNTIDILVEIGLHGALGGPIGQILSHYGVENIIYHSMLTRNEKSLSRMLSTASEMFINGLQLDVQKVNGDKECKLISSLPPYAWYAS